MWSKNCVDVSKNWAQLHVKPIDVFKNFIEDIFDSSRLACKSRLFKEKRKTKNKKASNFHQEKKLRIHKIFFVFFFQIMLILQELQLLFHKD